MSIKVSNQLTKTFARAINHYKKDSPQLISLQLLATRLQSFQSENNIDCLKCEAASWMIHEKPNTQEVDFKLLKCKLDLWQSPVDKLKDDIFYLGFVVPGSTSFCSEFCATQEELKEKLGRKDNGKDSK